MDSAHTDTSTSSLPAPESTNIKRFAIKAGIVTVLFLTVLNSILPDFSKLKRLETPKAKLFLLSFVQNPRVLLKISEIEEAEGKLDNAIRETELALGLLEMHGAAGHTTNLYLNRIKTLRAKQIDATAGDRVGMTGQ